MSLEIHEGDTPMLSPPTKTPLAVTPATSCPTTPSPMKKRGHMTSSNLYPSKKQATASLRPDCDQPCPHDFWVTVWFNGERTANPATVKAHTILAAFKTSGYITACEITPSTGLSNVFTDDQLWAKATLNYPPSLATDLLESPIITTNQSVVLFTPYPCPTSSISQKELDYLHERRTTNSQVADDIKVHSIIPGGRPFTWSRSRLIELNIHIQDNEARRVETPTIHILQELIDMMEKVNAHENV
ncbi:hypothetical protein AGABI2DRAFT_181562 [Agaricus bisporus var. bisporus H97]|uniref:hypothetical protein n=1 Tax=Agaricus bisporus var. bisporus (strain H97 / ATCC MYA-4626 / FGSC 10389) TaxID=936046 RepID=UPI00029F58EA|nr:hypothetical protein AGABI2DRAFT_181562 [Agaricus bisporus var. bisporus H97]EKV42039.1 hypothetical protein AGABI2DRAFT_181562 [Agaricus bisporus var. bisporus H97]